MADTTMNSDVLSVALALPVCVTINSALAGPPLLDFPKLTHGFFDQGPFDGNQGSGRHRRFFLLRQEHGADRVCGTKIVGIPNHAGVAGAHCFPPGRDGFHVLPAQAPNGFVQIGKGVRRHLGIRPTPIKTILPIPLWTT